MIITKYRLTAHKEKDNYYSEHKIIKWENNVNRLLSLNKKIPVQDENLSFERNKKDET